MISVYQVNSINHLQKPTLGVNLTWLYVSLLVYDALLIIPYPQPERIKGESRGTVSAYTISSDVWSLGLTIIELAHGRYPYPPETYENVFAQLQAIVNGDPPELPDDEDIPGMANGEAQADGDMSGVLKKEKYVYSETARDWVAWCMRKDPERRGKYAELLVSFFACLSRYRLSFCSRNTPS